MPTMMRDAAISFPMLGNLTLNFPASFSFTLFDHEFTIYLYGIVMAIAFLAAVFYASRRAPRVGIKSDDIFSLVLWVLPIAMVGLPHLLRHKRVGPLQGRISSPSSTYGKAVSPCTAVPSPVS